MSHIKVGQHDFYLTEQFFFVFLLCYKHESVDGSSFFIQMKATEVFLLRPSSVGAKWTRTMLPYVLLVLKRYRKSNFQNILQIFKKHYHFKHISNIKLLIAIREQTTI